MVLVLQNEAGVLLFCHNRFWCFLQFLHFSFLVFFSFNTGRNTRLTIRTLKLSFNNGRPLAGQVLLFKQSVFALTANILFSVAMHKQRTYRFILEGIADGYGK